MTDSSFLELSAMVAAHERLIRDLLVNVIGRMAQPMDAFDQYAARALSKPLHATAPDADAAESDLLNQLISEALERTLTGARSDLLAGLRQEHRRRPKSQR